MEALYGAAENRMKLDLPARGERIMAVIEQIVDERIAQAMKVRSAD